MQIGYVGLGRMGGNMVRRIYRDSDHEVVAFDRDHGVVEALASETGAAAAARSKSWSPSCRRRGPCG
jgi:6-phosphogluconate dehydrogenase